MLYRQGQGDEPLASAGLSGFQAGDWSRRSSAVAWSQSPPMRSIWGALPNSSYASRSTTIDNISVTVKDEHSVLLQCKGNLAVDQRLRRLCD
jgi:hypothetical protein